jgi:hypothetical protein
METLNSRVFRFQQIDGASSARATSRWCSSTCKSKICCSMPWPTPVWSRLAFHPLISGIKRCVCAASCCGLRVGPTRYALRAFSVVDNESHVELLSQALSRHSVPFDLSSEMHRRGKVFGFQFVAGGVGEGRSCGRDQLDNVTMG